ncbi:hypothetical protein GSI_10975 [Ganoderma sinense ZZ0214-1]|uniref:Uncharacterized protein n=1 Tax=Ganoderma sinense ZZ0214-1 TaxID=1077348 RepID=A0A2G8S242_9APHY|nr:hypothetical protein GSI_10975 [Ganoderma sinense ZZ0214-1]
MKVDWGEFLARFTACTELGDTLNDLYNILRGLFDDRRPQLTPTLKHQYIDIVLTADASVKVFHLHLESAQKHFTTHQAALEVMCMTAAEVRIFAMRLDNPASRSQNIQGVRPLLADLLAQHDLRVALKGQAGTLYNELTDTLASNTSIQRRLFNEKMSEYDTMLTTLRGQEKTQGETLKKAMVYFDRAASTPAMLTGLWQGTTVDVASLRSAPTEFREILETIEIMEDLSVPLRHMLVGVTSTLRRGVPLNVNRDLMDAARFISALGTTAGLSS